MGLRGKHEDVGVHWLVLLACEAKAVSEILRTGSPAPNGGLLRRTRGLTVMAMEKRIES